MIIVFIAAFVLGVIAGQHTTHYELDPLIIDLEEKIAKLEATGV